MPSGERDCCPFPRTPFLAPSRLPPLRSGPSGPRRLLDQAEHFLPNQKASVATLRLLFGTGPESCSASLRNAVRLRRNAHKAAGKAAFQPDELRSIIGCRMPQPKWVLLGIAPFGNVYRSKVPGGWLIYAYGESNEEAMPSAHGGLTFCPDPTHQWDGTSLE